MLPIGIDWLNTYMPAALAIWHGQSPYGDSVFYAAPWSVIPLIPFALMPYEIGRWSVFVLGFAAFAFTAYRYRIPAHSPVKKSSSNHGQGRVPKPIKPWSLSRKKTPVNCDDEVCKNEE